MYILQSGERSHTCCRGHNDPFYGFVGVLASTLVCFQGPGQHLQLFFRKSPLSLPFPPCFAMIVDVKYENTASVLQAGTTLKYNLYPRVPTCIQVETTHCEIWPEMALLTGSSSFSFLSSYSCYWNLPRLPASTSILPWEHVLN